jgi:hypothetical protein
MDFAISAVFFFFVVRASPVSELAGFVAISNKLEQDDHELKKGYSKHITI